MQTKSIISGEVAEIVDDTTIIINIGSRHGVSDGDRFIVYRYKEEIKDPKTGESLGQWEEVIGKGKVTHVQEKMSTLESDSFDETIKIRKRPNLMYLGSIISNYNENSDEFIQKIRLSFKNPLKGDKVKTITI